jgi:hypothetical protein
VNSLLCISRERRISLFWRKSFGPVLRIKHDKDNGNEEQETTLLQFSIILFNSVNELNALVLRYMEDVSVEFDRSYQCHMMMRMLIAQAT